MRTHSFDPWYPVGDPTKLKSVCKSIILVIYLLFIVGCILIALGWKRKC